MISIVEVDETYIGGAVARAENCPRCHVANLVPLIEADGSIMGERCPACKATWRSA